MIEDDDDLNKPGDYGAWDEEDRDVFVKNEILALVLDEPITEEDSLEYRVRFATGMLELGGDGHWVQYLTGLRVDENREWYIHDLNPPFFTLEELLKPDPAMPEKLN